MRDIDYTRDMEMNYCRRCGSALSLVQGHVYKCTNGHTIYANASPACAIWIVNDKKEVLVATRAYNPGKGLLDAPGGFIDGAETIESGIARELKEEVGLSPESYTKPEFVLSGIDKYHYSNEIIDVLSFMFSAQVIGEPTLNPQDDVAEASFMPVDVIDPEKICFPTVKESFLILRDKLKEESL